MHATAEIVIDTVLERRVQLSKELDEIFTPNAIWKYV